MRDAAIDRAVLDTLHFLADTSTRTARIGLSTRFDGSELRSIVEDSFETLDLLISLEAALDFEFPERFDGSNIETVVDLCNYIDMIRTFARNKSRH